MTVTETFDEIAATFNRQPVTHNGCVWVSSDIADYCYRLVAAGADATDSETTFGVLLRRLAFDLAMSAHDHDSRATAAAADPDFGIDVDMCDGIDIGATMTRHGWEQVVLFADSCRDAVRKNNGPAEADTFFREFERVADLAYWSDVA